MFEASSGDIQTALNRFLDSFGPFSHRFFRLFGVVVAALLSASSSIKVEILTAGEKSYNVPEALDLVTVRDLDRKRTFEFRIDNPEESIPPYVEYFARHVSQNTIANVTDSEGNIYRLLLEDVKRRPCLDAMTRLEDRIVEAKYRRELGNTCFRASLYEVALRRYEESLRCTDYCHVLFHDSSDLPSADRETLFSFLNAAACHLKLKNYEEREEMLIPKITT